MADKALKIDDVKKPGKSAPETTSRPLIVTNRPIIANDPMMVAPAAGAPELKPAEPLARTAKVIKPLDASLSAPVTVPGLTASVAAVSQAAEAADNKTTVPVKDAAPELPTPEPLVPDSAPILVPATDTKAGSPADAKPDGPSGALPPVAVTIPVDIKKTDEPAVDATVSDAKPDADIQKSDTDSKAPRPAAQASILRPPTIPEVQPADARVATTNSVEITADAETDARSDAASPATEEAQATKPAAEAEEPTAPSSSIPETKPATSSTPSASETEDLQRDPQATATAEEAAALEAKTAREQQLEQLVASGKYFVPINAVQRKRSRTYALLLCLLALVLAAALLDAALDAGLITLPVNLPHTNILSK
jgi:hypothetical protein